MSDAGKTKAPARGSWRAAALPALWIALFFVAPFAIVARIALSQSAQALPPYAPLWTGWGDLPGFLAQLDFANFVTLWNDNLYTDAFAAALATSAEATAIALPIGFPLAYAMACAPRRRQPLLMFLVILPFWISFLIRVYAWIAILRPDGLLDWLLMAAGLAAEPLRLLNTQTAVLIGMVYSYLPFMVLPLYAALSRLDPALLEAAADLGATRWTRFWTITVPLAWPGIVAGCALMFIPATGEFVIPDLLGGPDTLMIGKVLWTEFFSNRDWPLASAAAVVLLVLILGPILLLQTRARRT